MSARLDLNDYIRFFESEPIETHDEGWYYGVRFAVARGEDNLLVAVAPDNAAFTLEWKQKGQQRLLLDLKMVVDLKIEQGPTGELLLLRINTGPAALCSFDSCIIRLKPNIDVEVHMQWGPGWDPSSG